MQVLEYLFWGAIGGVGGLVIAVLIAPLWSKGR